MKFWYGYGTEHSMNLVMIGHFKNANDAIETEKMIKHLTEKLKDKVEVGNSSDRFSEEVLKILRDVNCSLLSPLELEHFLYDTSIKLDEDKIILTTDESEVSAFFKLMIENGARVEIFSAHEYPDSKYGRGK